jgi:L-aminopeptidase/D-esterase-like protein
MYRPGPLNLITDVPGLRVGHATDEAVMTGVTTVLCEGDWTGGVDVRGGGPGSRETEVLAPENFVDLVHAVVLTGGSVFGLGAADGVTTALSHRDVGLRLRPGSPAIPIVPAAVLHDLGNGGDKAWGMTPPYQALGVASVAAAERQFALGSVGAGRGAMAGMVKGGIGSTSLDLGDGLVVGALVATNPVGSVFMPDAKTYWAWPFEIDGEFGGQRPSPDLSAIDPMPEQSRLQVSGRLTPGANTTLAVVAVSARLTKSEAKRLAIMAQDGLARAIRPVHAPYDGDTVFALSGRSVEIGEGPDRLAQLTRLGSAAADCLARAIARAVYSAQQPPSA